jgi:1,3-beta-glucanosyltransferase GAS1
MRDIVFLSQLSTNVIRVSYIDPTQDHTACMSALQTAGIYVFVDLPTNQTINSTNPQWNLDIYNSWIQKIDAVAGFNNVLGFFAGNNIVTNSSNSPAAAFVKAAVRDLKSYINSKYNRDIPVGYELNAAANYDIVSSYMTCGSNTSATIDFLGISDFNLCSNNTNQSFDLITAEYGQYPVPVFFADYGCRDTPGSTRTFAEVQNIYGNPMTNIISGGIVFEYFQDEASNGMKSDSGRIELLKLIPISGLVSISGTHVTPLADFTSYSSQIAKITPSPTFASNYVVSNTFTPSCSTGAAFSASPTLPPVVSQNICACMVASLGCISKPGLDPAIIAARYQNTCGTTSENCPALHGNGANGTYGAFSICSIEDRLSWALDKLYEYTTGGCYNDPYAVVTHSSYYPRSGANCAEALYEAGPSGTGTITTFPTATNSSQPEYTFISTTDYSPVLSNGAIAGIVVGGIVILTAFVLGCIRLCCWKGKRRGCGCCTRRRELGFQEDATKNENQYHSGSQHSKSPDQLGGVRGGGASIISDDSRGMVELQPWDERYLPPRSNGEFPSTGSRPEIPAHGSAGEGSAYVSHQRHKSSISQHSGPEPVSPLAAPSPMSSVKELPGFRTHDQPEEKSLAGMKFLSPVVKVSPVPDADN